MLSQGVDLSDILHRCCEAMVSHLDCAFARIWTVNDEGDTLILGASAGLYTHIDGPHGQVPVGQYKIGRIAQDRSPHLTNSVADDPYVSDQEWARREGMVAFAGYPLTVEGRLVGVMAMFARHVLSEQAIQAMSTVASGIAIGIERKHADLELRDRAERIQLLLDSTGEGIFGVDFEGACTFCNPAGLRLLGFDTSDQVMGKRFHALFHHTRADGSPLPESECPIYQSFRLGKAVHSDDDVFWRKNSTSFPVEYQSRPVRRGAETIGAVITFTDITRRKEAEAAMRESEERLRLMFESIRDYAIVGFDLDGRIASWNAGAERLFGWTEAEIIGRDNSIFFTPEDRAAGIPEMELTGAREKGRVEGEGWNLRHDGSRYYGSSLLVPVRDAAGDLRGYAKIARDITERKQNEAELHRAKEAAEAVRQVAEAAQEAAEAASRAKSTFLANMSHELRTPLNAIIGYSEMIQEEAEEEGRITEAADLKKVHAAGKHLLGLINDILDLSKIEAGKMDLYIETFDITEMAQDVAATVRPLADQNGNILKVDVRENLGMMNADLTKVRQVLLNLLSNAIKFTNNGEVRFSAVREHSQETEWLIFEVADTGIGMSSDQLTKLFQPFTQADASTTRKYGGTGLGLTITRRFCQMMGGDVTVKSVAGAGSTFTARIPSRAIGPDGSGNLTGSSNLTEIDAGSGLLVLVIDDDPSVHDLLKRTLVKEGFRVICASSGAEGLRLAREFRPDAITLDVMMPGIDGWSVLSSIKSDPALAETLVIMVTMVDDKNLGYALGAADYLTKPIDRERLSAILRKHRQQYAAESVALVVEDDVMTRELVREMLKKEGWTVIEAENGKVALERLQDRRPDLILLDLMMPEMDGFGFTTELRRHEEWSDIPILVMTAKDLTEEDRERLNGDVLAYLAKGACTREELLRQIRREMTAHLRRSQKSARRR